MTPSQRNRPHRRCRTVWQLPSLIATGHDCARFACAVHALPALVRRVVRGQARTARCEFSAVCCQLRGAWRDKTPPQRTPAERCATARARRQPARHDWPAGAGLDADLPDKPGYRPWCRYRPATGMGAAPDFPPARPRPAVTREIA